MDFCPLKQVLYRTSDNNVLWTSENEEKGHKAKMEWSGRFVIYDSDDEDVWATTSELNEFEGGFLNMEDDGLLVRQSFNLKQKT